jgi:hypothetical protein
MKKILIIVSLLFVTCKVFCQEPAVGSITLNPALDKFVGTWKWADGNGNEVIIMMKKIMYHWKTRGGFYDEEALIGSHSYKKNGILIESNLTNFPDISQNIPGSIVLYTRVDGTAPYDVWGSFEEISKTYKEETLDLTYHIAATPTLDWDLRNRADVNVYPLSDPRSDMTLTLPQRLVLVKQP